MLQAQITAASWPIPGDVSSLDAIIGDQAETMAAQAALIDAYQANLAAAQNPAGTPATSNAAVQTSTTSMVVTGTVGTIQIGSTVTAAGIAFAPTLKVIGQISGTAGGDGTYLMNQPVAFTAVTALTFTPHGVVTATATGTAAASPNANQLTVSGVTGAIANGATVTNGALIPSGTTILGQISGTPGGAGVYLTSQPTTAANTPLTFTTVAEVVPSWPVPQDAPTLTLIQQQQSGILRLQTALIQGYQDLLNTSQTPAPPSGP